MKKPVSNYDLQADVGKKFFLEYDQELRIRKVSLQTDKQWIYLTIEDAVTVAEILLERIVNAE